jgi:hypothetical protein
VRRVDRHGGDPRKSETSAVVDADLEVGAWLVVLVQATQELVTVHAWTLLVRLGLSFALCCCDLGGRA